MLTANQWAFPLLEDFFVYRAFGCPEFERQPRRWKQAMRLLALEFGIAELTRPKLV